MKYLGSKRLYADELLPVILDGRREDQLYVEPFVGGCNMIERVYGRRIGGDKNCFLIEMWKALQNGWVPPKTVTRKEYFEIKNNQDNYHPAIVGLVAIGASWGTKWWGGFPKNKESVALGVNSLLKQVKNLVGVKFVCCNYWEVPLEPFSIIYCDPPYAGTTGYKERAFHKTFWLWVRSMTKKGHSVFVSEISAPDDFETLVEIEQKAGWGDRVERLFAWRGR